MQQSEKIRAYVLAKYIEPARRRGEKTVTIRAGDVRHEMGLQQGQNRSVCGALDTDIFRDAVDAVNPECVTKNHPNGKGNGANVYFTVRLDG